VKSKKHNDELIYSIRMRRELLERIGAAAKREDLTSAQFIRRAAERDLDARENVFQRSLRRIAK
jgi:predicted DNA-binding protein